MKGKRSRTFDLGLLFSLLLTTPVFATQITYTFYPLADSFLTGSEHLNDNDGLATNLRIQHPPRFSHVLLKFSQSDLISTLGTNHIVSANLKLYVETNFNNWGSGSYVDVHRIIEDWGETSVTWNCAIDSNTGNSNPDCEDEWAGGYYDQYVSASLLHQNSQTGWKSFNVISDVQVFVNGYDHFGWLLRKRNSTDGGSIDYTSIQGSATNKPRLEVTIDTVTTCTPTVIESIDPGWIASNGSSNTLTVKGSALNNVYQVLRNNSSITYTVVDPNTITFSLSSSTAETHTVQFNSNCVTSPLDLYIIEATQALEEPLDPPGINCPSPAGVTQFSRGWPTTNPNVKKYLCYKGQAVVRLIGNTVPPLVTDDSAYKNNGTGPTCMNKNLSNCTSSSPDTQNRGFFENARYISQHGSNMIRVWVFGFSGTYLHTPNTCDPPGSRCESMPFKRNQSVPKTYIVKATPSRPALDGRYIRRLKQVLMEANNNGQTVLLSLFDHGAFKDDETYGGSCWDPSNNDLGTGCQLPATGNAGAQFYNICSSANGSVCANSNLTCLGLAEKNLVDRIMNIVKTGNNGGSFKKVIIELANEASQFDGWGSVSINVYKTWYRTVAKWVKDKGGYMVAVNPGPEKYAGSAAQKYLFDCTSSSCTNQYDVVNDSRVDLLSLHAGAWSNFPEGSGLQFDTCKVAQRAVNNFSKPVIVNDDGTDAVPERNTNTTVESWANAASVNCSGLGKGTAHFEHLEEGSEQPNSVNCTPLMETGFVDCDSYNQLGDVNGLSNFCSLANSSCPALSATQYCVARGCYP